MLAQRLITAAAGVPVIIAVVSSVVRSTPVSRSSSRLRPLNRRGPQPLIDPTLARLSGSGLPRTGGARRNHGGDRITPISTTGPALPLPLSASLSLVLMPNAQSAAGWLGDDCGGGVHQDLG
jgi:hypothetical protein